MISITRQSPFTGKIHTMEVEATEQDLALWEAGMPIQMVFPRMPAEIREFIMTGITPEEWDRAFGTNPEQDALQGDGQYEEEASDNE